MEDFKSRKFILCMLVVLLATVLVWARRIDAVDYVRIACFAIASYVLGNVGQKGLDWWLGGTSAEAAPVSREVKQP